MQTRINKFISETGFCSRREADKLIEAGRVTINGIKPEMGTKVNLGDTIEIDGKPLKSKETPVYLAFNKPVCITCTTDLKDKNNIIDFIKYPKRIFPIGRLDKPSEGLIFLTNDGDIVNKILRAGNNHEKEYVVVTDKAITEGFVNSMRNGISLSGIVTKKCFVKQEGKNIFRIILTEGLNRQIRRMCAKLEYKVISLKRVRIMNITLHGLPPGKWRHFSPKEISEINSLVVHSSKTAGDESMGE